MRRTLLAISLSAAALASSGCATHYIPNTDVEDTSENRKVITFCEQYRRAVELQDVGALLKLAAPSYYEDGGNADATDDIDYAGLKDYLTSKFSSASGIRYEIRYRRVKKGEVCNGVRKEDCTPRWFVDYTYSASYRIPGMKGDEWHRRVEENRLEIVPMGEEMKITAGM